ncbi:MAG TPA: LacI family DNA-binding transcriptional regulator [Nocardioidaceae bacterium]|nr:LacI family DNA-binding transcriptional regulator [Nocardioidaceae bacterium]
MAASISEVAKHAGVSVGTVSNVLNRPELVAPETRERVLRSIESLDFVRNESARALRAGSTRTIGLVVLDVANPYFTDVARGVEQVADENDMVVTLCNSAEDTKREDRHLQHLEEQRVRGVLITPVTEQCPRLEPMIARGIPGVLVDRGSGQPNRCSVAVDDRMGGRLAGAHLIDQGHRRLGFVGGPMSIRQVSDRHAGMRDAIEATKGLPRLRLFEQASLSIQCGREAGQQFDGLSERRRPTAVFCANDLLALGFLQEMTRQGLRVPHDIAIVGYDDIVYAGAAAIALSSVRQPREQLGRAAAELLIEEIGDDGSHRHRQVVFEPELIVRDSSVTK